MGDGTTHWSAVWLRCVGKHAARLDERDDSWSRCDRTYREGHRLEVVVDGLSLFGGVQLRIDTTPVSPLGRDSTAQRHEIGFR